MAETATMSKTAHVMEALLAGESLSSTDVAERWDSSGTLLYSVVKKMEAEGHRVTSRIEGGRTHYFMESMASNVGANGSASNGNGHSTATTPGPVTAVETKTFGWESTPMIGEQLTVVGINLGPDGTVIHTLRDGDGVRYEVEFPTE